MTDTPAPAFDLESIKDGLPEGPWQVDPDYRPGMEWNNHVIDANGLTVCFMAHSGKADNDKLEAAARAIAALPATVRQLKAALNREDILRSENLRLRARVAELEKALELSTSRFQAISDLVSPGLNSDIIAYNLAALTKGETSPEGE